MYVTEILLKVALKTITLTPLYILQMTHISPVSDADESANFEDCPVQSGYMQGLRDNIGSRFTIVSCTCISRCNVEFSLISYFEIYVTYIF